MSEEEPTKRRICSYCGKNKPETLQHFTMRLRRRAHETVMAFNTQCIPCVKEKEEARRLARKFGEPPPPLDKRTPNEATFDGTVEAIEAQHGPFKTWSRDVHYKHTQMLWNEVAKQEGDMELLPEAESMRFANHPKMDYGNPLWRPPEKPVVRDDGKGFRKTC